MSIISSLFSILLSISKKRIQTALNNIKNHLADPDLQDTATEILLVDLKGSIQVLFYLLDSPDELSIHALDILLSLTIDSSYFPYFISQCSSPNIISTLSESVRKSVSRGLRNVKIEEFEESLLILLQKLTSQESLKCMFGKEQLCEILMQRARSCEGEDFFISNLNSILRNLS